MREIAAASAVGKTAVLPGARADTCFVSQRFDADVPFLRFGCIALPLHDGMAFGGNRSFSSNINLSLQGS